MAHDQVPRRDYFRLDCVMTSLFAYLSSAHYLAQRNRISNTLQHQVIETYTSSYLTNQVTRYNG